MENNYVIVGGQLYHHGVKGMKWGVRKKPKTSSRLTLDEKKAAYKTAKRDYSKSFNKAYRTKHQVYSLSKKRREAQDAKWDDAFNKAEALKKAKGEYKSARQAYDAENPGSARVRKATTIGTAAAATILAGVGVYAVSKYLSNKKARNTGKSVVTSLVQSQRRSDWINL